MGVYNNNKDGTRSTLANTIQVVNAPMEQFVSRGEFNAVVPSDTSADNKLVNSDTVDTKLNDIWKANGELGAKNLLKKPYDTPTPYVSGGITFSDNEDGGIVINGTSTTYITLQIMRRLEALPHGKYILSIQEDLPSGVVLQFGYVTASGTVTFVQKGYNALTRRSMMVILDDEFDGNFVCVRIGINSNTTVDNLVVHPMLRYASDIDDTWQPYAPTNRELADVANDIWKVQGELGAKNLISYPYKNFENSTTLGVTFVINNDGGITLNGTATANIYKLLLTRDFGNQPFSSIYNNPNAPYLITLLNGTNDVHCNYNPNDHYTTLVVEKGATIDNLTVYPMLRYKSDTDDTWQPYAPTNYQLNQKVDMTAGVYLPNATNTGTKKVVASIGQTSVTFDATSFINQYNVTASDLDLDISAETSSGDVVAYNNVSVTGGIVTVTFDALTEQTTFICKCSVIQ